ncbi:MAG: hydrogenase maturation protease [Helicobacteraceae bacterium]|nr:hydrogenase maturation protease [Helicobacteraceae bacterium]
MKTLLIGYGNALREDDGFGVFVARSLKKTRRYECMELFQLTPELAETIARFDKAIFVDANADVSEGVFAVPLPKPESVFAHSLTPWSLLETARKLYSAKTEYLIFSVGGRSFGYNENLTPPLKEAALKLIAYLKKN